MQTNLEKYLEVTENLYAKAAITPQPGLCCTKTPVWQLPGLQLPKKMLAMNYGCGTTVHPRDLANGPTVLYVGVGGGMELFQFSYFTRRKHSVIGVDSVQEMLEACRTNLDEALALNQWFDRSFIELKKGSALDLPVEDSTVDVAAQNCLFNIFKLRDLKRALSEMYRVLKPRGRLILSDPICEAGIPALLQDNEELRALCLTGALPLKEYIALITNAGFGTIEVRARRPYRILHPTRYDVASPLYIESIEIAAIKDPLPDDGACVFTGKSAIYFGNKELFDDGNGHVLLNNQPLSICDKTASNLSQLKRQDLFISESTWFYDGGGCC